MPRSREIHRPQAAHAYCRRPTPPPPSLRNLAKRKVDIAKALKNKISMAKMPGAPEEYQYILLNEDDLEHLEVFLQQLNDMDDKMFRRVILNATILDTSSD